MSFPVQNKFSPKKKSRKLLTSRVQALPPYSYLTQLVWRENCCEIERELFGKYATIRGTWFREHSLSLACGKQQWGGRGKIMCFSHSNMWAIYQVWPHSQTHISPDQLPQWLDRREWVHFSSQFPGPASEMKFQRILDFEWFHSSCVLIFQGFNSAARSESTTARRRREDVGQGSRISNP